MQSNYGKNSQQHLDYQKPQGLIKVSGGSSSNLAKKPLSLPQQSDKVFKFLEHYYDYCQALDKIDEGNSAAENKIKNNYKKLLKPEDTTYLTHYKKDSFNDMLENEYKQCFDNMYAKQTEITTQLRASLIDWLFGCFEQLKM